MACDAATLEALAVLTNKENGLSHRDILICLASVYGTFAGFGSAVVARAVASMTKLPRLSDRDLDMAFLQTICSTSTIPLSPLLDIFGNPVLDIFGNPVYASQ